MWQKVAIFSKLIYHHRSLSVAHCHTPCHRRRPGISGCCRTYLEQSALRRRISHPHAHQQSSELVWRPISFLTVLPMIVKCQRSDSCHFEHFNRSFVHVSATVQDIATKFYVPVRTITEVEISYLWKSKTWTANILKINKLPNLRNGLEYLHRNLERC